MKILNFGSLNVDYVYAVENFVRPGETISSLKRETFCGGKGLNQSIALARAGAKVWHAGKIGSDGLMLLEQLRENGVDVSNIAVSEGPSGHAIIQVNQKGQNCIILYGGSNKEIDKDFIHKVLDSFSAGDLVLLQNEISNIDYIIDYAYQKGIKIALNPSPIDASLLQCPLHKVEWFILNEIEGNQISGETEPTKIIDAIVKKYPGSKVVLTLGKDGVLCFDGTNSYFHGIYDVPVVDTTAAGDTFTGYFLSCMSQGLTPDVALEKASKASSLSVAIKGASNSIPFRKEVDTTTIKLEERFLK